MSALSTGQDRIPDYPLVVELHRKGVLAEAIEGYRRLLSVHPEHLPSLFNLGAAYFQTGDFGSALACFQEALKHDANLAEAYYNGGNALRMLDRPHDAEAWYHDALRIQPSHADAHFNLANLCRCQGRFQEAIAHFRITLKLDPHSDEAWNNLGICWLEAGRSDEAVACFERAVRSNGHNRDALYNLGMAYNQQGRAERAAACVGRVLDEDPRHGPAMALNVQLRQQLCDWDQLAIAAEHLERATAQDLRHGRRPAESPFLSFTRSPDPQRNLDVARAWSHEAEQRLRAVKAKLDTEQPYCLSVELPIKIGYLSAQFRDAATSHLTASLFEHHDRGKFRIVAYSLGKDDASVYRRRVEQGVDEFVDLGRCAMPDIARRMRRDGIHILVDLIGWMHGQRMEILALRAAPIQVSYLGFPGTTGADFMDYIIADATVIPPGHEKYYAEKVVRMPHCYQCTDPEPPVDPVVFTREQCGLPQNGFVFASFNTDYKIEPKLFATWMHILKAVPDSVLWLLVRAGTARANLKKQALAAGIDPDRLVFAEPLPKARHLARLALADLALDTVTVNGHTTTSDALWAGVPVVTRKGSHFASRVAASILQAVGIPSLISGDEQAYAQTAIRLATDRRSLAEVKSRLARQRAAFPLFDIRRFVRNLESAYLHMWRRYQEGLAPLGFDVSDQPSGRALQHGEKKEHTVEDRSGNPASSGRSPV